MSILIVEDSDTQAKIIEWQIQKWTIEVTVRRAATLAEAIISIKQQAPTVVLLDLNLPDSDGIDTVRAISGRSREVAIIVLTARADDELGQRAIAAGAQDFLSKSEINERALLRAFRYAVQRQRVINHNDELAEQLRRERAALAQAQKLESIGQLAAGIAHEINTPAQYVGDNVRFLREQFEVFLQIAESHLQLLDGADSVTAWPERAKRCRELLASLDVEFARREVPAALEQAMEGLDRVTTIVRAMKDFSHPGTAHKEPANLNRAIQSTVTVCRARWKYVADVEMELEEQLPDVPCIVAEFNQVVLNLIVNAVDAIAERNKLAADKKGRIRVRTRVNGDHAEVSVTDDGCGMPESIQQRIFDPFFTTKEVGKGTGQGLSICRDVIVNKHGGSIGVRSAPGVGTTFLIRLPLVPGASVGTPRPTAA
jgi:signal transduction histidine kinase